MLAKGRSGEKGRRSILIGRSLRQSWGMGNILFGDDELMSEVLVRKKVLFLEQKRGGK